MAINTMCIQYGLLGTVRDLGKSFPSRSSLSFQSDCVSAIITTMKTPSQLTRTLPGNDLKIQVSILPDFRSPGG